MLTSLPLADPYVAAEDLLAGDFLGVCHGPSSSRPSTAGPQPVPGGADLQGQPAEEELQNPEPEAPVPGGGYLQNTEPDVPGHPRSGDPGDRSVCSCDLRSFLFHSRLFLMIVGSILIFFITLYKLVWVNYSPEWYSAVTRL